MAGHSKWAQIKRQKGVNDVKKSKVFSKYSKLISLAARKGADLSMSPDLRTVVDKAKAENMPMDNIQRAIDKGSGKLGGAALESVRYEAYGPGGAAIIIDAITDNTNRTVSEIKHLLSQNGGKFAQQGSVLWAFNFTDGKPKPVMEVEIREQDKELLAALIDALEEHDDTQEVFTNAK
ncbi:MAG: YebC/PmpR family DNA-binding transcriptional regulator [bacterium]|nr:YebC/PmpR family DNA-binding transcriptional regulator [bacterium]